MKKTWIIIEREYLTRVRKKTFVISTLLFPLLYVALIGGMGFIAEKSKETLTVAVIDSSGYFTKEAIEAENQVDPSSSLVLLSNAPEQSKQEEENGYDGYIEIPSLNWQQGNDSLVFKTYKSYGSASTGVVEAKLNRIWRRLLNDSLQLDVRKQMIMAQSKIGLVTKNISDEQANSATAEGIGYFAGFLVYFILLIYGSQVMMGVMEEKTNRIAEVIVSSVRPFQMMLGKILGIGAVALTQFLIWIIFVFVVYNVGIKSGTSMGFMAEAVGGVQRMIGSVNVPLILGCFAFYFLGGFFFYASLYGAIGSAVNEDMREAQSLSFPITMLVILSIAIMTAAVANPTGPVAVWGSIIPFSSPIVMMARIPYGVPGTVPLWQLGLSMALLIAGFLFTVWFAGKIYRTGILMYGKKVTWKEMIRWAFTKG
ncbi:MAG: ABC transporter permease [Bacteroidetes bacterium]|nr:ABC transporter permease [Bacteroidota bacterium]